MILRTATATILYVAASHALAAEVTALAAGAAKELVARIETSFTEATGHRSQSSEIVQHKGVRYIGVLPVPYQLATRYQIATLKVRPLGVSFADFVVTERRKQASRDSGFEPYK